MCDLTIYHNPRCSKSRQTLELIRGQGLEPEIVLYLGDVPAAEDIQDALRMLGMKPMDLIRKNETEFKEHFGRHLCTSLCASVITCRHMICL